MKTSAFDVQLNLRDPSWLQLDVLTTGFWSEANLAISHSVEGKQRYFFPGIVLSFVKDIALLQAKAADGTGLCEMPVSGGHELCWSFYDAVDAALEAGDVRRLRLLWEVSNQVTVRLRLNPTPSQIGLDRLTMSDQLRVKFQGTGAQSFFFVCADIFSLPDVAIALKTAGGVACQKFVILLGTLGVTYKGKTIDKSIGHAMLAVQPFALDHHCREAVAFLERVAPKVFEDLTRVMRCCQKVKMNTVAGIGGDSSEAFKFAVENMAVCLLGGDASDEGVFTVQMIAGAGKSDPGLAATAVFKLKLVRWFLSFADQRISSASGDSATLTPEGLQKLQSVSASPLEFYQKFARARSIAAQDSKTCTLRTLCQENMATFCSGLRGTAEPAAFEFLANVFCFEGDDEARDFAISGRAFSAYFETGGGEDGAASGEDNGMPLHEAFSKFKKKLTEAPLDAERPSDGAQVIPVVEGDVTSEIKAKIYQQVLSKRKEKQKFYYLNSWEKKPWADGGDATGIFQRSAFAASGAQVSAPGKVNKLMMFSPSFFRALTFSLP